jgi:T-complex protein 1 subunit theta
MSLKLQPNVGLQTVLKEGTKLQRGLDEAVFRNIAAVCELAAITRSSFGPGGLNKLIVNHLGKLFLTADAGVILKELEVQHPAARIILLASQQQDAEMGDGTNAVVILASALLDRARDLLKMGLKPSVVSEGYAIAHQKAQELLVNLAVDSKDGLEKIIMTVLMAKQYGVEDTLSKLVLQACLMVNEHRINEESDRQQLVNPDNIRCVKIMGGTLSDSFVLPGVVLNRLPESACKSFIGNARVAIFTCPIDVAQTETKGTVLFNNASEMLAFSKGEEHLIEQRVKEIADAGIKVLITNEKIGEMAMHFINRHNLIAFRVQSKFDLQRLYRVTGASTLIRFAVPTPEQCGWCEAVEAIELGADQCSVVRNAGSRIASIILRGATLNQMDDYERAIEDAINVVRVLAKRDERVVAGAGAAESELSKQLSEFAMATPGIVQYPLRAYAEALEAIPCALATNAGFDRTDAMAKLLAVHAAGHANHGIAIDGTAREPLIDALSTGILDSLAVKQRVLDLAFDAANTVLMTDQIIMSKPAGGPKPRAPAATDAD